MPTTQRNRMFSSIQNTDKNHCAFQYGWSDSAVITGSANQITGSWVAQTFDPSGYTILSPIGMSGNYGFFNSAITGSQTSIPAGALSWSIYIESGVASVNGLTYNTFETLAGGGYNGAKLLSSAINVGCTGSASAPCRVLLSWEV